MRPHSYAVDVYYDVRENLLTILSELRSHGEENKPVIIQETYFNDRQAREDILAVMAQGLNVRTIFQWPVTRQVMEEKGIIHFDMDYPADYGWYRNIPLPYISKAESRCNDFECEVWLSGGNWQKDSYVDIRRPGEWNEVLVSIPPMEIKRISDHQISFKIPKQSPAYKILEKQGIMVWVVNPSDGVWSEGVEVRQ